MFTLPWELALFFIVVVAGQVILFGLAVYYLFSKNYSSLPLAVSGILFLSVIFFIAFKYLDGDVYSAAGYSSLPVAVLAAVFDDIPLIGYFFIAAGLAVNYLSIFAFVNSIHKILNRIFA